MQPDHTVLPTNCILQLRPRPRTYMHSLSLQYDRDDSEHVINTWTNGITRRSQTSAKAADPTKFLQLPLSRSGINSVKNSWIHSLIRINTKIEWSVANETSHSSKIHQKSSTTSRVIGKIRSILRIFLDSSTLPSPPLPSPPPSLPSPLVPPSP